MRARFIGDPANGGEGPETLSAYGVDFVKGEWATVQTPIGFARLAKNSHFEVDADDDGEADLSPDAMRAALDAAGVKYHPQRGPQEEINRRRQRLTANNAKTTSNADAVSAADLSEA